MSTSIKFPEQHYIGMIVSRGNNGAKDQLPLAFMTPDGQDAAARKRKDTVDRWVSSNSRETPPPAVSMKNEAMGGYRLLDSVRHYSSFGSGSTKWRVEDPRGFELEISSPNLMSIMNNTVIDGGEILDHCIWARDGSENVLVPVTSDIYKTAVVNTERASVVVSNKDLLPGCYAVLQNGKEGRFIGKFYPVSWDWRDRSNEAIKLDSKKKAVFLTNDNQVFTVATPKLASITPGDPIDPIDGMKLLNDGTHSDYSCLGYALTTVEMIRTKIPASLPVEPGYRTRVVEFDGKIWSVAMSYRANEYDLTAIKEEIWNQHSLISSMQNNRDFYFRTHSSPYSRTATPAQLANCPVWKQSRKLVFAEGIEVSIDK